MRPKGKKRDIEMRDSYTYDNYHRFKARKGKIFNQRKV